MSASHREELLERELSADGEKENCKGAGGSLFAKPTVRVKLLGRETCRQRLCSRELAASFERY